MPVNNVDKRMEGKGTMKVAEKDPLTHIDLELMDNMKRVFDEAKKEGFKGTFKDFLDTLSEEDLKTLFLEKGGLVAKVKEPKAVKKWTSLLVSSRSLLAITVPPPAGHSIDFFACDIKPGFGN